VTAPGELTSPTKGEGEEEEEEEEDDDDSVDEA
jgi:hypothetical protein